MATHQHTLAQRDGRLAARHVSAVLPHLRRLVRPSSTQSRPCPRDAARWGDLLCLTCSRSAVGAPGPTPPCPEGSVARMNSSVPGAARRLRRAAAVALVATLGVVSVVLALDPGLVGLSDRHRV